ncbi:MAG: hypothetical protein WKG01_19615 [Kofleriaceae bacterium]
MRLTSIAACIAAVLALALPAHAQQQAELAAKLNEEGKDLMYAGKVPEATAKFREAVNRVPEPKYFINLCASLLQEAKFSEALTQCNAVERNNPTAEQREKTAKLTGRIKAEAKAQGIDDVQPIGGGGNPDQSVCAQNPQDPSCQVAPPADFCAQHPQDPSCQAGPPQSQPAVGRPLTGQGLFTSISPDNKYTWTLGIDLYGGGGQVGETTPFQYYGSAAGGVRVKGDYLLNAASRIGAQAYFQLTHFGAGQMDDALVDTLDIFDLGIAGYKHFCLANTQRLCVTPLIGAHLALMSPAGMDDGAGSQVFNYAALGGRVELAFQYAFGTRFEHVLGIQIGANGYTKVFADPSEGFTRDEVGLSKGGAFGYFGAGYTYRFNTPLGSSPFVTLE